MNIIETNISNIDVSKIDKSKVVLADKIIENVYPLFNEVYSDKLTSIEPSKRELQLKKEQVITEKNELEALLKELSRKKKIKKLLERLSKLVSSGLVYDGSSRTETIVLLKIIDNLPENKIDQHLQNTMKNIAKRFGKL